MSLNKSVPERVVKVSSPQNASLDYASLVRFLIEPFLESPESLSIDCEQSQASARVWIRVAFEGADKGRVFGRGGRNIQAVRTVIEATAQAAGQSAYLDIYGSGGQTREIASGDKPIVKKSPERPSSPSRAPSKFPSRNPPEIREKWGQDQ